MRHDDNENQLRAETVGRFLKRKRLEANLTQWDIARELEYTTAQFVSNWERGVSMPPIVVLSKLTELLGADPREVVEVLIDYQQRTLVQYRKRLAAVLKVKA